MRQNLDKMPTIAREWFDEARSAPTLAEAAFRHRKAQLALNALIALPTIPIAARGSRPGADRTDFSFKVDGFRNRKNPAQ